MTNKYIFITLILLFASYYSYSQNNFNDKIIESEKKAFYQKASFTHSINSSATNIIYNRIHWTVDPAVRYISGKVISYYKITENGTSEISFDLSEPLIVDSVIHINGNLSFTHANSLLQITLPEALQAGTLDSLTIVYHGVPTSSTGFGSFTTTQTNSGNPVLWTLSEPYGAKDWWPCKQNLHDKIDSIDIIVTVPTGNKVGTNGVLISEKIDGAETTFHWKHRYPIAAYLVAIAVTNYSEFSDVADIGDGKTVNILNYVYPEDLENLREDAKYTMEVMELFSELFIPYPFHKEKYGHAQFGWGGGMEHQTMSFMYNFGKDLVAHELAHQWFGNHVTCGSWEDIWINEGFATYLTGLTYEHLNPNNWMGWKEDNIDYVLDNAEEGSVIVDDTTSVNRIFSSALSYKKGALVLHMLRYQIGDDAFYEGCKQLLSLPETSGKFAKTPQLQDIFETAADTNLSSFFDTWLYQQGYPKYQINWEQHLNGTVNLHIQQTTTHESVTCFKMHVPILLKGENEEKLITVHQTVADQRFTVNSDFAVNEIVFDPDLNILAPHPAWIIVNVDESMEDNDLKLYPNPVSHELIVKTEKPNIIQQITIVANDGKHIYSTNNLNQKRKVTIDVSHIKSGVYYIKAIVNEKEIVKQFIIN